MKQRKARKIIKALQTGRHLRWKYPTLLAASVKVTGQADARYLAEAAMLGMVVRNAKRLADVFRVLREAGADAAKQMVAFSNELDEVLSA